MICKSIHVFGLVQGVSFRYSTKKKADSLDLYGTVQNRTDGSVYIEVLGNKENIKVFLEWCHNGPPMARVDKIDILTIELKSFNSFEIIRS